MVLFYVTRLPLVDGNMTCIKSLCLDVSAQGHSCLCCCAVWELANLSFYWETMRRGASASDGLWCTSLPLPSPPLLTIGQQYTPLRSATWTARAHGQLLCPMLILSLRLSVTTKTARIGHTCLSACRVGFCGESFDSVRRNVTRGISWVQSRFRLPCAHSESQALHARELNCFAQLK